MMTQTQALVPASQYAGGPQAQRNMWDKVLGFSCVSVGSETAIAWPFTNSGREGLSSVQGAGSFVSHTAALPTSFMVHGAATQKHPS